MNSIREKINNHIYAQVVQFSPVRTGSTLVWNALRCLYPDSYIPKRHTLSWPMCIVGNPCRIVCTVRDPRDVLSSLLRINRQEPSSEAAQRHLEEMMRNGMDHLLKIVDRPRTLVLRYEEFYRDHQFLFDRLEAFLNKHCAPDVRQDFVRRFSAERVRERGRELGSFERFDPVEHIHGQHVSESLGLAGGYKKNLPEDACRLVEKRCQKIMNLYSYV